MKNEILEKQYRQITALYDMAEELASTVESGFVQDTDAQIAIVEPLVHQVADSADILSEEFVTLFEVPAGKKTAKGRIEGALRKVFTALEEYRNRVGLRSKKTVVALANIADPIVEKIRKQVEKITVIFMQLVNLSLDRIMHKYEAEEFRRSNEKAFSTITTTQLGY